MTQEELTILNIGENLDSLMNLDPRGYGVCRILYAGSRAYTGEPTSMHCAKELVKLLRAGDVVYILAGFILMPHARPETDGIVSAVLLARVLVKAFDAKPVVICPEDCADAVKAMTAECGLHLYNSVEDTKKYPFSIGMLTFPHGHEAGVARADEIIAMGLPKAVIADECPGANAKGVYHNAVANDYSAQECREDVLFAKLQAAGVWNMAVGDLGNECGMGAIADHIKKYIPYAAEGSCSCGCGGGILAATAADHILTATVSDWGVYAMIAAIAFLRDDEEILHTPDLEDRVLRAAARNGMVDMYGEPKPAIDGFDVETEAALVAMMHECIRYAPTLRTKCKTWFEKTIELGFFE